MTTARDFQHYTTKKLERQYLAVSFTQPKVKLSSLAKKYIQAGEREGWHHKPSFASIVDDGGDWFQLRLSGAAPILFIKTMQYTPVVLINDGDVPVNQRLYEVYPTSGLHPLELCAVMNSTIFCAERYAAVKALGREAAIDVEVFTAKSFRIPDLRLYSKKSRTKLRTLMQKLKSRAASSFLEEEFFSMGHAAAMAYARRNPVGSDTWPAGLQDPVRREIDEVILECIGLQDSQIKGTLDEIYNELSEHTRKLRILELEAQINRAGTGSGGAPSARKLADELWAELLSENAIVLRQIPNDFIQAGSISTSVTVPTGAIHVVRNMSLFDPIDQYKCRIGRTALQFDYEAQMNLVIFLAEYGFSGSIEMSNDPAECERSLDLMQEYKTNVAELFASKATDITNDPDLHKEIIKEGLRRTKGH